MVRRSGGCRLSGGAWVFGYGSLASPASLRRTLERSVDTAEGWRTGHLEGFGRRWNYGSQRWRGHWHHEGVDVRAGVVVALGLVTAVEESCNGALVRVTREELALLDRRESDYTRTEVTELVTLDDGRLDGPAYTYVPRASAVERYEEARDSGRAGVRRDYWDLVHDAFAAIGPGHAELMADTPAPDVPVVEVTLVRID